MQFAILGSCVTRDIFGILGLDEFVASYDARQTIRAAVTPDHPPLERALSSIASGGFDARSMLAASRKQTFDRIAASTGSAILLDLIDERFSTRTNGRSVFALSTGFPATALAGWDHWRPTEARTITATLEAIPEFCDRLSEAATTRPIVLHRAFWSDLDPTAEVINAALRRYYDAVELALGCDSIEPHASLRVSDPGHKWGLAPYHYGLAYYQEAWRLLRETGVNTTATAA